MTSLMAATSPQGPNVWTESLTSTFESTKHDGKEFERSEFTIVNTDGIFKPTPM